MGDFVGMCRLHDGADHLRRAKLPSFSNRRNYSAVIDDGWLMITKSVFVADMQRGPKCELIQWADWPPPSGPSAHVVVKIGNRAGRGNEPTLSIKDQLKACRFRWESSNEWPAWVRSERRDGFSVSGNSSTA